MASRSAAQLINFCNIIPPSVLSREIVSAGLKVGQALLFCEFARLSSDVCSQQFKFVDAARKVGRMAGPLGCFVLNLCPQFIKANRSRKPFPAITSLLCFH